MTIVLDGTNGISTPDLESAGPVTGTTATFSGNVTLGSSVLATPTGSAPSYTCRAWVNFNGTGTVAIRASGNVSSITDAGVGNYVVNFANAMPDGNYATSLAVGPDAAFGSGAAATRSFFINSTGLTGVQVITGYQSAPAYLDFPGLYVAVFR